MHQTYTYQKFVYTPPAELQQESVARRPLVIVGAGPVGLAAAIDARLQGIEVLLVDEDDTVSVGSRGLCYAKRTLDVLDRLGCGDPVVEKGVGWDVGRTFFHDDEVFNFNLQPQAGFKRPGMVNLQQYYLEQYLVEAMRVTMTKEEFDQEFNCEFVAAPGQFITREMFRKCIHHDVKPLFEEDIFGKK